ncbi:MAG: zinc finger domain-containing protein [Candidatus Aenigmatarchaeota archaeon]
MVLKCTSCNKTLISEEKFSQFNCPKCGECEIVRCRNCRHQSILYVCPKCKFEGP